ncbi:MAG: hypothetical protein ACKPEY_04465 [Planctomycetota bacterium]
MKQMRNVRRCSGLRLAILAIGAVVIGELVIVKPAVLRADEPSGVSAWNPMTWGQAFSSSSPKKKPTPKPSNTPSTWSKVSSNTKSFATNTQYTLMPWTKPSKPVPAPLSGSRVSKSKSAAAAKSESSWWMPSWMSSTPKREKSTETVTDWVGKSRPDF